MKGADFIQLLGVPFDDPKIKPMLKACGISKLPKWDPDDHTSITEIKKLGLDISFKDEGYLDVKSDAYKDGAMVFCHVRMLSEGHRDYQPFTWGLPHDLTFGLDLKEATKVLKAKPAWTDSDKDFARWDFKGYCLFLSFDKADGLWQVALQLPLE